LCGHIQYRPHTSIGGDDNAVSTRTDHANPSDLSNRHPPYCYRTPPSPDIGAYDDERTS